MKKIVFIFILLQFLQISATTIDGQLQIPLTEVAPVIDGQMDAVWSYAGKERNDVYVLEAGSSPGDWLDQWSTFRIMWDNSGIYCYFEVLDDLLDVTPSNDYEKDSIEIFWDMDNSKNGVATGYDEDDFQWRMVLNQTTIDVGTGYAPLGSVAAFVETEFGYACEVYFPTADWLTDVKADQEVGFEIQINDCDNGTREHMGRWFGDTNETWHDPSSFGEAVFRGSDYRILSDMLDINYIEGVPIIDGEKEDWWDALPNVGMNTYIDAAWETDITLMTGAYDHDFSAWQGWNEDGFYLFISVIDDELSVANANPWEEDSIELYFDGDNSKNDVSTGYDDNDKQIRVVLNETRSAEVAGVVAAWIETDKGVDVEIFWPAADLPFNLEEDIEIGYEIQVNDDDGNGTREGMARWWSNSNETWHDPSIFGEARLVKQEGTPTQPSEDIDKKCMFVVGNDPLWLGDHAMFDQLVDWGIEVSVVLASDLEFLGDVDYKEWDFILASESAGSGAYAPLKSIPLPLLSMEGWATKPTSLAWSDPASTENIVPEPVIIVNEAKDHPLAAGYNPGDVINLISDPAGLLTPHKPTIDIIPIAVLESDPTKYLVYGVEKGTVLNDGTIVRNRAAMVAIHEFGYPSITTAGWAFIQAGIKWIVNETPPEQSGKLVIESPVVYDFYGGDHRIQPGEFFRIEFNVANYTNQNYDSIYILPDSSYDAYVHPLSQYYFDSHLSVDNPPRPGKSSRVDPLDCFVAWDTPIGHEIVIPLAFYGDGEWVSNDTLRIMVHGYYNMEPFYDYPSISHSTITSGEVLEFSVKIFEAGSILNPQAIVKNEDGEVVALIPLYDDGSHGDTLSGDRVYHTNWVFSKTGNYTIDISAEDNLGAIGLARNYFSFVCTQKDEPVFDRVPSTGSSQIVVIKNVIVDQRNLVAGDMIGVFDDTLCVGLGLYQGTFPMSISIVNEVSLPNGKRLPGAKSGNGITYKIYDNQSRKTYRGRANYEIGNNIFGNQLTVISRLSNTNLLVPIKANRLSWVTFHELFGSRVAENVFDGIRGLKLVMDDVGNHYLPEYGINTLGIIQPLKGYFVYLTGQDQVIHYNGDFLDPETITFDLDASHMHLIGSPCFGNFSAEDVFDSIKESVVIVQSNAGKYWIPEYNYNTIPSIDFGVAYQIYLKEDVTFTFPKLSQSVSKSKNVNRDAVKLNLSPQYFEYIETGLPLALVITESKESLEIGDEIAVFDGNLCVGAAVFNGSFPLVVTAWEGSDDMGIQGFKIGNPVTFKIWKQSENQEQILNATSESNEAVQFIKTAMLKLILNQSQSSVQIGSIIPATFALNQNYPNPFNPQTTIEYQLAKDSDINLTIYNMVGQKVKNLVNGRQSAGCFEVVWNGQSEGGIRVESGLYLVRFDTDVGSFTRKIMMIK